MPQLRVSVCLPAVLTEDFAGFFSPPMNLSRHMFRSYLKLGHDNVSLNVFQFVIRKQLYLT